MSSKRRKVLWQLQKQWATKSVNIGDLVQAGDSKGIVLNVEYVKAGQHWVTCLWNDGKIDGISEDDIVILCDEKHKNESR